MHEPVFVSLYLGIKMNGVYMKHTNWDLALLDESIGMDKIAISSKDLEKLVIKPAVKAKRLVMDAPDTLNRKQFDYNNKYKLLKGRLKELKARGANQDLIDEFKRNVKKAKKKLNSGKLSDRGMDQPAVAFRHKQLNAFSDPSLSTKERLESALEYRRLVESGMKNKDVKRYLDKKYKGTAFVSHDLLEKQKSSRDLIDKIMLDPKESKTYKNLVGAHELEELQDPRKTLGTKWGANRGVSKGSHHALQSIGDIQRVRSMPINDSPLAQKAIRSQRLDEVDAMLAHAPGLSPVLKGYSSKSNDIDSMVRSIIEENKIHNSNLQARVANMGEGAKSYISKKLKPTDYNEVHQMVRNTEEPRINRHMKRHIGNVLDNSKEIKKLETGPNADYLQKVIGDIENKNVNMQPFVKSKKLLPTSLPTQPQPTGIINTVKPKYRRYGSSSLQNHSYDAPTLPGLQNHSYDAPTLPNSRGAY